MVITSIAGRLVMKMMTMEMMTTRTRIRRSLISTMNGMTGSSTTMMMVMTTESSPKILLSEEAYAGDVKSPA